MGWTVLPLYWLVGSCPDLDLNSSVQFNGGEPHAESRLSKQRVDHLRNPKPKTHLGHFTIAVCYITPYIRLHTFDVFSRIHNVKSSKNKENTLNEEVCPNVGTLCASDCLSQFKLPHVG